MTVLPELLAVRYRSRRDRIRRALGNDDLQQRHLVHGREEVHPQHSLGPARNLRDAAQPESCSYSSRRSPAASRQPPPREARCASPPDPRILPRSPGRRSRNRCSRSCRLPSTCVRVLNARDLSPGQPLLHDAADGRQSLADVIPVGVLHPHDGAVLNRDAGDPRSHESGAQHADLVDAERRCAVSVRKAAVLLERSVAKKRKISCFDASVAAISPNRRASSRSPAGIP